ncbi:MAG TPA: amino acid permease [Vicinamibacterales bacterium]|nr:amino acid permease [Vicinamibacterales bacterium]
MSTAKPAPAELPRALGLFDSASILVGIVIGAGIFLVPRLIAQALPSPPMILAVWISSGVLCFFGGLAYAEMGAMMPETGGHYVYLRECYGPLAGFLCGWTFTLVVLSAAMAWLAVSFSITLGYFLPLGALSSKLIALALIITLSAVNYRGIRLGATVQNLLTVLKVLGLAIVAGSAFLPGRGAAAADWSIPRGGLSWTAVGVAMVPVVLCYDGWPSVSNVAGEVRNPKRNIPLSLGMGLAAVTVIYVLANIAYLRVLPVTLIAATDRVGAALAERTLGRAGGTILSLTILLSIAGAINGFIITAPRLCFAMARDGLMFRRFAEIHPRHQTLSFGIAAQAIWTVLLVLTGTFETLVPYAMIAAWFFYGLAVAGVVILRRKYPDRARPYRMWGYPLTPWLFTAVAVWFVANTWITQPWPSTVAFLIVLSGVPVYFLWRRRLA